MKSSGFTLVEVLVALAILTVGLIPAFMQATDALVISTAVRNSLIASNLAQEGVEVVRAIRDQDWFEGNLPYGTSLTGCASGCRVQWDSGAGNILGLSGNPALKLDPASGMYQYSSGADTIFKRQMTVTAVAPHHLLVVARIDWQERSGPKTFSLEYHLYDWLQ